MQPAEKPLADRARKDAAEHLVPFVAGAQAIAVADVKYPAIKSAGNRRVVNGYIQLVDKIIFHPKIMVSREKMNAYPGIGEFRDLPKQPYKAFRDGVPVFIPEVKKISDKENFSGIMPDRVEPLAYQLLAVQAAFRRGYAQVKIGCKIYFFTVQNNEFCRTYFGPNL